MTNVLNAIASKESFADSGVNKKNLSNIRNTNFRYNRFYKPTKKTRSSNRSSVIKRQKEPAKQPIPTQNKNMKQSKRYGSVPKNLNNSFPSIKNSAAQPNSGVFSYALPNPNTKVTKKNMNIYNKNAASNVVGAQHSANTSAANIKLNDRSMSPMINSQKLPQNIEQKNRITSYENMKVNQSNAIEKQMLIKKFKDTNNSSNGTMNKSTISQNNKFHSLNTLKDHGMNMSNKAMTLQMDQDNIEEIHAIVVAFHHSTKGLLDRVEGKPPQAKGQSTAKLKQNRNFLIVECTEDIDL